MDRSESTSSSAEVPRDGLIVIRLWCDGNGTSQIRARVVEVELDDTIETSTVCDGADSIIDVVARAVTRFATEPERFFDGNDRCDGAATPW